MFIFEYKKVCLLIQNLKKIYIYIYMLLFMFMLCSFSKQKTFIFIFMIYFYLNIIFENNSNMPSS